MSDPGESQELRRRRNCRHRQVDLGENSRPIPKDIFERGQISFRES
jgi:hypothetical protein